MNPSYSSYNPPKWTGLTYPYFMPIYISMISPSNGWSYPSIIPKYIPITLFPVVFQETSPRGPTIAVGAIYIYIAPIFPYTPKANQHIVGKCWEYRESNCWIIQLPTHRPRLLRQSAVSLQRDASLGFFFIPATEGWSLPILAIYKPVIRAII